MTSNPFASTSPHILPSILSADFAKLGAEIAEVLAGGGDFLHLDVMDGHFVPNLSFGPPIVKATRKITSAFLDCHLMISDPLRYAPALVEAGADLLTFHVEAVADAVHVAGEIRKIGTRVGVTLRPHTPIETILPVLDHVDLVLVMSVVPGFSGQKFMPIALPKCEVIKKRLRADQRLEIDGGVNRETIKSCLDAGVDWFVVASAIFDQPDRTTATQTLRSQLGQ